MLIDEICRAGRLIRWVPGALLLTAACGVEEPAGPSGAELPLRPNIVLVTIDTLRADHLGCYGYFRDTSPRIDGFAKEGVVFDAAYATMATTLPSHASILTARYPLEHGILANLMHGGKPFGWKPGMVSFAQVAKEAGYATAGFVSAAPLKQQSGIAEGFDTWSEPAQVERAAGETLADVLPWLRSSAVQPFFLWVHFYDPHWKHRAPPPFDRLFHGDEEAAELDRWIAERGIGDSAVRTNARKTTETRAAINDYCGEVRYADDQFGVLLDELKKLGLYDDAIVVLTADHGEGLNQHDWTAHGLVWEEQLRVPLVMRFPASAAVAPRQVSQIVSLIDLLPTVLAHMQPLTTPLALQFLEQATGVDALAPDYAERPVFGQRTEREMAEDPGEMYAVTTRNWKYIHEPDVGDKLFDRRTDPHELVNVLEREVDTSKRVHSLMQVMMVEQKIRGDSLGEAEAGELDPELLEQLRKLGYMGGDDGRLQKPKK